MSPQLESISVQQQSTPLHDLSGQLARNSGVNPSTPIDAESLEKAGQKASPISSEELESAINRLNKEMSNSQRSLRFSLDKETDEIIVQVIDRKTDSIIREIPNSELPRLTDYNGDMIGLLLDKQG